MNFEKELIYLNEQKDKIFSDWFDALDVHSPSLNTLTKLETQANLLFKFTCDFDIPVGKHSLLGHIPKWCKEAYDKHKTLSNSLISYNYWRNTIISTLLDYKNSNNASGCIKMLLTRFGEFEMIYCETFWQLSLRSLNEKDSKIDNMHEDRLNIIGKMASSMAHEIRNPLTSIGGFLKLIRINIQKGNLLKLNDYIEIIDDEFDIINMQITGFLSFSKNRAMEEKNIEISTLQIVNATLSLLNPRLINDNIDLKINEENNSIIYIQKIAIQQVISNIIGNAIDALNSVDYQRKIRIFFDQDDEYNYIHIVNNGPKIPRKMRDSLFLPFITDKDNGTGLGLAICKEIMAANNGEIYLKSNDEQTSFILSFSKQIIMF